MTTQPERLHHLLDRARRGVILPAEGEQLAEMVGELGERLADYENRINWHTTCASCARILDSAYAETVRAETAEARVAELEADNARYEEVVVGELNEANTSLQRQAARAEANVARVRQAVDAGPVGSCCAHLIRAALNPPAT
ncbi:hypothetical protein [Streptomyces sp. NPDC006863]|uniref:hypothetical protein n=1 Tax=Streptomyces sp. NPDC006863 TaxID=3154779 RepID=UPI00341042AA